MRSPPARRRARSRHAPAEYKACVKSGSLVTLGFVHGQHGHFLSAGELTTLSLEQMPARLVALCKPNLLINEMAYLPFDRPAANFLLQLVSRRYERGAIILTSNKSYGEWGEVFSVSSKVGREGRGNVPYTVST